ncbi:flagellar motor switch protein FliM [Sporichthya brevicatena]|uniref:Flagellar motor switch protein FliM n=1 Tax=Sporichthya brevicatena TaxID=171442 RepID=A0ABN1GE09_9ACTN
MGFAQAHPPAAEQSTVADGQFGVTTLGRNRRGSRTEPRAYDFRRSTKLSRKHVRSLEIVFETFARQWGTLMTSSLRTVTTVHVASIEELTYDEYISRLSNPTMVNVLSVEPLAGAGILELSMTSAMVSVDRLLGGPGTGEQPQRPLTDIEVGLLSTIVTRVLGELRYAFEPIARMEPDVTAIEYNPQFVQAAAAADVLIVAGFDLRIGETEAPATLCLPFASLFPLLEVAIGAGADPQRAATPTPVPVRVEERISAVPIEVSVGFAPTTFTPRTLVSLAVGDVLRLNHRAAAPLVVTAADVTFAHAVPGTRGQALACRIVDTPPEPAPGSTS